MVAGTGIAVLLSVTALVVVLTLDGQTTDGEALAMMIATIVGVAILLAVCIKADRHL